MAQLEPRQAAHLVDFGILEDELCDEPVPAFTLADDDLEQCETPPNAARAEAWCLLNPDSTDAACRGAKPPVGAPNKGAPGTGAEPSTDGDASGEPRLASSCQFAPPAAGGGLALLALLAAALLRRRVRLGNIS